MAILLFKIEAIIVLILMHTVMNYYDDVKFYTTSMCDIDLLISIKNLICQFACATLIEKIKFMTDCKNRAEYCHYDNVWFKYDCDDIESESGDPCQNKYCKKSCMMMHYRVQICISIEFVNFDWISLFKHIDILNYYQRCHVRICYCKKQIPKEIYYVYYTNDDNPRLRYYCNAGHICDMQILNIIYDNNTIICKISAIGGQLNDIRRLTIMETYTIKNEIRCLLYSKKYNNGSE